MNLELTGKLWYWKGPAPWYFVTVPEPQCGNLRAIAKAVTYGWGMIPADVQIGTTGWTTSLFPKDGSFVVPVKASIRKAENLQEGDAVTLRLKIR